MKISIRVKHSLLIPALLAFGTEPCLLAERLGKTSDPGRQVFSANCAACHGLDGRGGERAPDIAGRKEVQRLSPAELLRIVEDGIPGTSMPAFRGLGAAQIRYVVAYLRILQGTQTKTTLLGNPPRGKAIFFGAAGCSQCHMVSGVGGFMASDLTNYGQSHSQSEIRRVIIDPETTLATRSQKFIAKTRDGREFAGIVRSEDNFSLQLQEESGTFHLFTKSELQSIEPAGSLMPTDYESRLTSEQIDDVTGYLISVAQPFPPSQKQ